MGPWMKDCRLQSCLQTPNYFCIQNIYGFTDKFSSYIKISISGINSKATTQVLQKYLGSFAQYNFIFSSTETIF